MGISIRFSPFKRVFSKVLGDLKGLSKSLNTKILHITGRREDATEEIALNDNDLDPGKELINFASTMVELRLVRDYNEYLSQEFHDLYEARTSRPSTSLNLGNIASMIRSEISWRCWRELDTPATLTIFTAALEEYHPHLQTPWINQTAQAARSLGIPMNGLILEIEDYANNFTNSTTMALPSQPPSIEILVEKGLWDSLAQRLARDMILADITFRQTEDRMNRVALKEAIDTCINHYFEVLRTDEDGTVRWYPTPSTREMMEVNANRS